MDVIGTITDALAALEKAAKAEADLRHELKRLRAVLELAGRGEPDQVAEYFEAALREAQQSLRVDAADSALMIIDEALRRQPVDNA